MLIRIFSFVLLQVYSLVLFQEGIMNGIHFISHTTEIISNQFSFHQHGNGKFHIHQHGVLDAVESILDHTTNQTNQHGDEQLPPVENQVKYHLPGEKDSTVVAIAHSISIFSFLSDFYISHQTEVLKPPPKV